MRHISLWASRNVWTSRIILSVLYFLIPLISILTGLILLESDFVLPAFTVWLGIGILSLSILKYPTNFAIKNHIRLGDRFFTHWKIFDLGIIAGSMLIFLQFGNDFQNRKSEDYIVFKEIATLASFPSTLAVVNVEKEQDIKTKRILAKMDKARLAIQNWVGKHVIKYVEDPAVRLLFILLIILLSIVLAYFVLAIACSLSCAGNEAGAAIVAVAGIGGIIALAIILLRRIFIRKDKKVFDKIEKKKEPKLQI